MPDLDKMKKFVENISEQKGYKLCSEESFLKELIKGLSENVERYGYPSCPCREAAGIKKLDKDIICPCVYADQDVEEYGTCYCGLYLDPEIDKNPLKIGPIPERRPKKLIKRSQNAKNAS